MPHSPQISETSMVIDSYICNCFAKTCNCKLTILTSVENKYDDGGVVGYDDTPLLSY
jgi:hypothetical protein